MRVIVKIGTSSLTSESGEVNVAALSKLVAEVVLAHQRPRRSFRGRVGRVWVPSRRSFSC